MRVLNVDLVHRAHENFMQAHVRMVSDILTYAGPSIVHETYVHPGFKSRHHGTGLLSATKPKVIRTRGGRLLRLTNNKPYARAIEDGANPHWIFPHKKKFLVFRGSDGRWVSKKFVTHPGNKPYKFLSRAIGAVAPHIERDLRAGMQNIARHTSAR